MKTRRDEIRLQLTRQLQKMVGEIVEGLLMAMDEDIDKFQKRECERNCSNTHLLLGRNPCPCSCHPWPNEGGDQPTPDVMEEKIEEIMEKYKTATGRENSMESVKVICGHINLGKKVVCWDCYSHLREEIDRLRKGTIVTGLEGTSYCSQCEIYARRAERYRTALIQIRDTCNSIKAESIAKSALSESEIGKPFSPLHEGPHMDPKLR